MRPEKPTTGARNRKHNEPTLTVSGKVPVSLAQALASKALANKISRSQALCDAVRAWVAAN